MKNLIKHIKRSLHIMGAGFIKNVLSIFNFWGHPFYYQQLKNKKLFTGIMKNDDWQKAYQSIKARQAAQAA